MKLKIVCKVWSEFMGTEESQFMIGYLNFHAMTAIYKKKIRSPKQFLVTCKYYLSVTW
jgi:hypothetical protein